ncbi:MAG: WG repeat-containing protein [Bacteroidia bacterium]|nr:WG repeat-containing protein [Bacteroidia bacterium]
MRVVLLFIGLWSADLFAGSIDKAFDALSVYDYFKAKKLFYRALKREPAAACFGLATIYFRRDNPFHQTDSATKYIRLSLKYFPAEYARHPEKFKKWNLQGRELEMLRDEIYELVFSRTRAVNTVNAFDSFIAGYEDAFCYGDAVQARDSLAFLSAQKIDSWAGYKEFSEKYPSSVFRAASDRLYEEKLFLAWTASGKLKSYESFIARFPESPHRDEAENIIFGLTTLGGTIDEYYLFIRNYPENRNVEQAWYNVYTLYTKDFKPETFSDFLKVFPDYPYSDNVNRDLELSRRILLPGRQNGKWGFVDSGGVWLIPPIYDWCEPFSGAVAAVGKDDKAGFIDKTGRVIFPLVFNEVESFSNGLAEVTLNGKSGVVSLTGKQIIPCEYEEIYTEPDAGLICLKKDGKYGYCDLKGSSVADFIFDKTDRFRMGTAPAEQNGKWGLIDMKGKWVVRPEYDGISPGSEGRYMKVVKNGRKGVIRYDGKEIIPCRFQEIGDCSENSFPVLDSAHIGYMDTSGNWIVKPVYEPSEPGCGFKNGLAVAWKAGKAGMIDRKGKFVIPFDYESIVLLPGEREMFLAKKNGKYGVIDRRSKVIIPFQYVQLSVTPAHGLLKAVKEKGGNAGLISTERKWLLNPEWETIDPAGDGKWFIITAEGGSGLFQTDAGIILPAEYESVEENGDYFLLEKGEKLFWLEPQSRRIIWREE